MRALMHDEQASVPALADLWASILIALEQSLQHLPDTADVRQTREYGQRVLRAARPRRK
jgi:hypothetical protein